MVKQVERIKISNSLAEIGQQNLTQFCLARYDSGQDKLIQCHQFVKCRDFMGDVWVGMEDNRDVHIYGFRFSKDNPRPDAKNCSLLLSFPDAATLKNFQENFDILTNIEEFLNWTPTFPDIVEFPGKERVVWVLGDPAWQHSAPAFAFYSYLLKCLTYPIKDKSKWMEEIKAQHTNEGGYMDVEYIKWFTTNLNEVNTEYKTFSGFTNQKEIQIGTIHNQTGFVAMKSLLFNKADLNKYSEQTYQTHVLINFLKHNSKEAA